MKTSMSLKQVVLIALLGSAMAAPVLAQSGAGAGAGGGPGGPGNGPCMQGGGQGMRYGQSNTPGWQLMTQDERTEMRNKMRSVKTYEECSKLQTEHRALMEVRAKEKGVTLREPRQNACDRMKAKGYFQ